MARRLGAAKHLRDAEQLARFEQIVLPHVDDAYNLARWLTRQEQDADDVVQEAFLRALQFFGGFQGGNGRAWLLSIVRNTCYTWLQRNRAREPATSFDEEIHSGARTSVSPETQSVVREERELLRQAIEQLPPEFRETIVLRELQGLSYKEIAEIVGIPMGTVMSRLARARDQLQQHLSDRLSEES
jgi:RNA polymerase sigma-70 factor (ECF subfamily)